MKELYPQSIEIGAGGDPTGAGNGRSALVAGGKSANERAFADARPEYNDYLRLSDFDSKLAGKMNYYVLGIWWASGRRSAPRRPTPGATCAAWLTSGCAIPSASRRISTAAIGYCQKSLAYDPNDPYAHYASGCVTAARPGSGSLETLASAGSHFHSMIDINPDLEEAKYARANLKAIEDVLAT